MRVLVITPDSYTGYGGIAQVTRDLLHVLNAMPQIETVTCLSRNSEQPEPAELPEKLDWIAPSAGNKAAFLAAFFRLFFSAKRYDLVLATHINLLLFGWLLRWRCGGRLAAVLHGVEAWWPRRRWLLAPLLGSVDAFLSVSEHTRQRFLRWAKVSPEAVLVHHNCVDLDRFTPGPPDDSLLRRYGLEGKRVLLLVSRLSPEDSANKGIDRMLAALPRLSKEENDLVFAVAGKGADKDRLQALAENQGVADRVRFLGFVPEADKPALYRSADAYVMPGRGEGFGLVYLEAMACGIPALGSTRDASQEVVAAVDFGVAVDPGDQEALIAGIKAVLALTKGERPAGVDAFSGQAYAARTSEILCGLLRGETVHRNEPSTT